MSPGCMSPSRNNNASLLMMCTLILENPLSIDAMRIKQNIAAPKDTPHSSDTIINHGTSFVLPSYT